jgi:hypothetical protein
MNIEVWRDDSLGNAMWMLMLLAFSWFLYALSTTQQNFDIGYFVMQIFTVIVAISSMWIMVSRYNQ